MAINFVLFALDGTNGWSGLGPLWRPPRRARAAEPRFIEVWVRTPRAECEARDVKGLYARASAGGPPTLPGVSAPYEPPVAPEVVANGGLDDDAAATIEARVRV